MKNKLCSCIIPVFNLADGGIEKGERILKKKKMPERIMQLIENMKPQI